MLKIVFGIIAGIISGMGMGGGTILIMLLTCFMNIEQTVAQATNLVFFIPTSVISTVINIKNKRINFKIAIPTIIFGVIGAVLGAFIATRIEVSLLRKLFAGFLIIIAFYECYEWYKKYFKNDDE